MYNCDEIWPVYETDQDYAAVVYPEFQEDFKTDTDIVWGTLETYQHDNTDVSCKRFNRKGHTYFAIT